MQPFPSAFAFFPTPFSGGRSRRFAEIQWQCLDRQVFPPSREPSDLYHTLGCGPGFDLQISSENVSSARRKTSRHQAWEWPELMAGLRKGKATSAAPVPAAAMVIPFTCLKSPLISSRGLEALCGGRSWCCGYPGSACSVPRQSSGTPLPPPQLHWGTMFCPSLDTIHSHPRHLAIQVCSQLE